MMFAIGGMLLFPASNDLLTMFVALEVLSLPLYLLCGLARRRRLLSQEAALKYFLLGAFSSAFFLYGVALLYGYAGSMRFGDIAEAVSGRIGGQVLLLAGIGLLAVGLLFKIGAAPFHAWTPDVYQGAPTPVTGVHGGLHQGRRVRRAAAGVLRRLRCGTLGLAADDLASSPILTMVVGAVLAITQTDIKRMLAYSSIAHAGFLLTGGFVGLHAVTSFDGSQLSSVQAVLFYLVAYGFMTIGAFAVVTLVRDAGGEATHLSRWAGLGKESPVVAGVFAFFLLAMAGIPLTSGFTGKWAVFASAVSGGAWPLVVVAVVLSAVAAFFYVRVIVLMFFSDPVGEGPVVMSPSILTTIVIAVGFAVTVVCWASSGPGPRPGSHSRPVHPLTHSQGTPMTSSTAGGNSSLALPVLDDELESRLRAQLALVEERLEREIQSEAPFVTEAARHLMHAGGQAVPPAAGAARRRDRRPVRRRRTHLGLRRGADPPRVALPRRRDGRGRAAPRRPVGERPLGQPRRDPHRRLPVLQVLGADRHAGRGRGAHPGRDVHPAGRGPDPRDAHARVGRDPLAHYLRVVEGKTGSLIATSARYGARFSGASLDVEEALTAYGERVGMAFQLSGRHPRHRLGLVRVGQDAGHRPA